MKKAFTLAEVMIVLTVIGVLTAILLPVARQSMPDKDLMKFKKAHNTLGTAIRELVTSDKYYLNGDLKYKPDNSLIDGSQEIDYTYHCETMADILNVKNKNCKKDTEQAPTCVFLQTDTYTLEQLKANADYCCKKYIDKGSFVNILDNISIYQTDNYTPYGALYAKTVNGFDLIYKIFCIDIDGVPDNATSSDCVNECPFGYGIRADGKILTGARADEWLERDVNEE